MRLINADALIDALNSQDLADWLSEQEEYTPASIVEHALEILPTVDAVPVVLIKEMLTRLRRRRKNLDDDCVDEAWDLKMQIEALEDLLNEWAWRNEE